MHPYKELPLTSFWSRSVSSNWAASSLLTGKQLLRRSDKIVSLGSCFAANLVPYLKKNGFNYIEEEVRHTSFADMPSENLSYGKFSAAYGNVYTARQFRQLLDRAIGVFSPQEDRWVLESGEIADSLRPGLRFRARTHQEFDALTRDHLRRVLSAFQKASVVVFTLGLTEAWTSKIDGTVFPACPGTIAGTFNPDKHVFHNFSVSEIVSDLEYIYLTLKIISPQIRLILTVSPVPLVATATSSHVLLASTYSKAVLRVACGQMLELHPEVTYFPAFEIITGPQASGSHFEADRRNVSASGVEEVMRAFLSSCDSQDAGAAPSISSYLNPQESTASKFNNVAASLSATLSQIECEEAAMDLPNSADKL